MFYVWKWLRIPLTSSPLNFEQLGRLTSTTTNSCAKTYVTRSETASIRRDRDTDLEGGFILSKQKVVVTWVMFGQALRHGNIVPHLTLLEITRFKAGKTFCSSCPHSTFQYCES